MSHQLLIAYAISVMMCAAFAEDAQTMVLAPNQSLAAEFRKLQPDRAEAIYNQSKLYIRGHISQIGKEILNQKEIQTGNIPIPVGYDPREFKDCRFLVLRGGKFLSKALYVTIVEIGIKLSYESGNPEVGDEIIAMQ